MYNSSSDVQSTLPRNRDKTVNFAVSNNFGDKSLVNFFQNLVAESLYS